MRLGLAALLGGISGCPQQEGDRCQLDSDCAAGLTCQLSHMGVLATGGVCESMALPTVDLMTSPGSQDMATPVLHDLATPPADTASRSDGAHD